MTEDKAPAPKVISLKDGKLKRAKTPLQKALAADAEPLSPEEEAQADKTESAETHGT